MTTSDRPSKGPVSGTGRAALSAWLVLGAVLVAGVGLLDVVTGPFVSVALFYLVPVALVAWRVGVVAGGIASVVAAATWLVADRMTATGPVHVAVPVWNAAIRLGFFSITAWLVGRLRNARDELATLARLDPLTGVLNARAFRDAANEELQSLSVEGQQAVAIALLDVDDFKTVNDRFGHAGGDRALRAVTRAISSALGPRDFVGRLGGDEFAVVLPATAGEDAVERLERIPEAIRVAMLAEGLPVSASIGACVFRGSPLDVEDALRHVDELAYDVKRCGKNALRVRGPERRRSQLELTTQADADAASDQ